MLREDVASSSSLARLQDGHRLHRLVEQPHLLLNRERSFLLYDSKTTVCRVKPVESPARLLI